MNKTLLFVIHGMGVHDQGWEDDLKTKLTDLTTRYPAFQETSLWNHVKLIPIRYDNHIVDALNQWQTEAGTASVFAEANKIDGSESLAWLNDIANEDSDFFWSHVADVVIYRFFELYRDRIRASVAKQIVDPIMAIPKSQRDFSRVLFLAHSLGTSVLHDSLHLLGTNQFAGLTNAFSPPTARFRAIMTLANVSRVLQNDINAYDSIVQPGPHNKRNSNCSRFFNFRHELDPICMVRRFDPEHFSTRGYIHRTLEHYHDWNLHGFEHYLDHPRVHIPLLNLAMGKNIVTTAQARAAVDSKAYPQFGGTFKDVPVLQQKLQELRTIVGSLRLESDLGDMLKAMTKSKKVLAEIKVIIENFDA